jgi:hypothetical protein
MKCPRCGGELPDIMKPQTKPLKAKVKATGGEVEVSDYGEKFVPRYWTDTTGYYSEQLEFPDQPQVHTLRKHQHLSRSQSTTSVAKPTPTTHPSLSPNSGFGFVVGVVAVNLYCCWCIVSGLCGLDVGSVPCLSVAVLFVTPLSRCLFVAGVLFLAKDGTGSL